MRKLGTAAAAALLLGGCVTTETVSFRATAPGQQAIMRDGQSALVSRQRNSIVLVRPASREIASGNRPVFAVGINNISQQPVNFMVSQVDAQQMINGQAYGMQVIPYEQLAQEERNAQVGRAILAVAVAGANAYGASHAGRGSYTNSRGQTRSFYSPTANAIAQNRAAYQNEALISATIENGQANLAALEQEVMKDNTLMPGEWYGGQLHVAPPADASGAGSKNYVLTLQVGPDRHVIDVSQGPVR